MFEFEPAIRNLEGRRVDAGKHCAEIVFLVLKRFFQNFIEELLVAIRQGLMDGRLGKTSAQAYVRVLASRNVPKNCDMMEPFQVGGNPSQPVRGKLFDDAPVLRKTLERLHGDSLKPWGC
jgi:hypothetical protein